MQVTTTETRCKTTLWRSEAVVLDPQQSSVLSQGFAGLTTIIKSCVVSLHTTLLNSWLPAPGVAPPFTVRYLHVLHKVYTSSGTLLYGTVPQYPIAPFTDRGLTVNAATMTMPQQNVLTVDRFGRILRFSRQNTR